MSLLEMDRTGGFSMLFLLFPSTKWPVVTRGFQECSGVVLAVSVGYNKFYRPAQRLAMIESYYGVYGTLFCFLDLKYNTSWSCVVGSYSVFPGDCLLFK